MKFGDIELQKIKDMQQEYRKMDLRGEDYARGVFDGLEYAIAVAEDRSPNLAEADAVAESETGAGADDVAGVDADAEAGGDGVDSADVG